MNKPIRQNYQALKTDNNLLDKTPFAKTNDKKIVTYENFTK